jgi:hypothetical protein
VTHPAATPPTAEQVEHSPFPWTLAMEGYRPYVRDANGTTILKFYRDSIGHPVPWEANVATVLAALAPAERAEALPEVQIRALPWIDQSAADFTLFCAETPIGRFVYGTDNQGLAYHQGPHGEEERPSEAIAKVCAEAAWRTFVLEKLRSYGVTITAPAERAEAVPDQDYASTIRRIWSQLGNPSYEELGGRSIFDLIDELKAAAAPTRAGALDAAGAINLLRQVLALADTGLWRDVSGDGIAGSPFIEAIRSAVS